MVTKKSYSIISTLLILGVLLIAGGLFASEVHGYDWGDDTPDTNKTFTLAQAVYKKVGDGGTREYLGDLLGVYAVGTKVCKAYTKSGRNLDCPADMERRENGWGILINGTPENLVENEPVVSEIMALIPVSTDGTLDKYILAKITGSDGTQGHQWTYNQDITGGSNVIIGVELILYDQASSPYLYPDSIYQ